MILVLSSEYQEVLKNILELMKTKKNPEKIRKLFNTKDKDDNTPLDLAIMSGSCDVVKILLDQGAEISKYRQKTNALHYCSR